MAQATPCQTPGAQFHIGIGIDIVKVTVDLPYGTLQDLTVEDAVLLEANLHNAVELVLARYFTTEPKDA